MADKASKFPMEKETFLTTHDVARLEQHSNNNNNKNDNTNNIHINSFDSSYLRMLRPLDGHPRTTSDGPVAVLIVVCVLFCFIWTPMLCQRRCRLRSQQLAEEEAAELIRVSLRNLQLWGLLDDGGGRRHGPGQQELSMFAAADGGGGGGGMQSHALSTSRGFTMEDRKEYIHNVLLSRVCIYILYCFCCDFVLH
jgi:hypothetical protein